MAVRLSQNAPKSSDRRSVRRTNIRQNNRGQQTMGAIGKPAEDAKSVKNDTKSRPSPPKVVEDDAEDGDIATPKRDRDDEQQDL
jgi:hypothetical protein